MWSVKEDSLLFVTKGWDINIAYFKPFQIVVSNRMHLYFPEFGGETAETH